MNPNPLPSPGMRLCMRLAVRLIIILIGTFPTARAQTDPSGTPPGVRRLLYVAAPGIRDYLEYGGHGILVFDIDHGHRFVKRIASSGVDAKGKPLNVKGVCACGDQAPLREHDPTAHEFRPGDRSPLVGTQVRSRLRPDVADAGRTPDFSPLIRGTALVCRAHRRRHGNRADHARFGRA